MCATLFTNIEVLFSGSNQLSLEKVSAVDNQTKVAVYRVYNPNSGEHLHTMNDNERSFLVSKGWKYEGISMLVSAQGDALYRVYNPNSGEHFFTRDFNEKESLKRHGWKDEGIAWYVPTTGMPMYRVYNPNSRGAGAHHYTVSLGERDMLVSRGWKAEGVSWNVYPILSDSLPNDEYAWRFFREKGFSKVGTAGIIGNLLAESNMNPLRTEAGATNGGRGIAQWGQCGVSSAGVKTGCRWKDLEAFAKRKSADPNKLQTQLEFVVEEMEQYKITDYFKTADELYVPNVGKYGGGTVGYFAEKYERPNVKYAHMDKRYSFAVAVMNRYGSI